MRQILAMMRRTPRLLCLIIALAIIAGCGPEFTPFWKVDKLRVIAIKADPVVAKPMEPVSLTAPVYVPDDQPVDYQWSWCPFRVSAQDDFQCPIDRDELSALLEMENGGFNGDDPFDLGSDPEATFINFFEPDEVREFCETLQRQVIEEFGDDQLAGFLPGGDCSQGYEITVRLEVTTDDDSVTASKRFLLWGGADEYNENPAIEALQVRPADGGDLPELVERADWEVAEFLSPADQWVTLEPDQTLTVIADIPLEIRSLVDPDSLQVYTPPTPRGSDAEPPRARRESIGYRYLLTTGQLGSSTRVYAPDENTLDQASVTTWSFDADILERECPDIDEAACETKVWSVIRDSRLGLDWVERTVEVIR